MPDPSSIPNAVPNAGPNAGPVDAPSGAARPETPPVESDAPGIFASRLSVEKAREAPRLNLDPAQVKNGLGQLVLTLVRLLHELLERQAIRRMDSGSLSEDEIERLGCALMAQAEEIDRLRKEFGLSEEDLNLDLGPLGRLL